MRNPKSAIIVKYKPNVHNSCCATQVVAHNLQILGFSYIPTVMVRGEDKMIPTEHQKCIFPFIHIAGQPYHTLLVCVFIFSTMFP